MFSPGLQSSPTATNESEPQTAQDSPSQDCSLRDDFASDSNPCPAPSFSHAFPDTMSAAVGPSCSVVDQPRDLTIEGIALLGLDQRSISRLLSRHFSPDSRSGVFCILGPWEELLCMNELQVDLDVEMTNDDQLSNLASALLAIALQAESRVGDMLVNSDKELLIDTLRVEALKSIPALTWKSRTLNLDQVLVLLLMSHTWCMKESLIEISDRWNSLARVIWQDLQHHNQALEHQSDAKNLL